MSEANAWLLTTLSDGQRLTPRTEVYESTHKFCRGRAETLDGSSLPMFAFLTKVRVVTLFNDVNKLVSNAVIAVDSRSRLVSPVSWAKDEGRDPPIAQERVNTSNTARH